MNSTLQPVSLPPLAAAALDVTFETDALTTLAELFARHGDAYRAHSPTLARDIWVLSHPDHVRHVLVDHHDNFTKGIGIERVAILLGNGIMTSEGDEWRVQRKLIQPAFHRKVVATWMPHIEATTVGLAAKWQRAADRGEPVNVTQDMSEAALDVVLRALFGPDLALLATAAGGNPFAMLTDHTSRNLAFAYEFRQLGKIIMRDVERRRRDGIRGHDIVSQLLDARDRQTGDAMSDRQLLDEIMTMIIAGHETTASSLNWFWYLLALTPDVAARVATEADAGGDAFPGHEDLAKYPYARRALDETLRMYPPGWLLTRRSIAASTLAGFASARAVRRADLAVPDPAPPRLLVEPRRVRSRPFPDGGQRHAQPFVYLPFGLGPRACIGEHFALIEMHAHVVFLARRFALTLVPGQTVEIEPQVNLRTRQPLLMHVRSRA